MKKTILLLAILLTLISCGTDKVKEVTNFKYNNAWYWVIEYTPEATKEDVVNFANTWANPEATSFFFAYPNTTDLMTFKADDMTFTKFRNLIINNKPTYGFYKMPTYDKLYDDGVWLLEQAK